MPNAEGRRLSARATSVGVAELYLTVHLEDGRILSVPIGWFPRLVRARGDPHRLSNWRLIGEGVGIHWPDLDEHISVENLLASSGDDLLSYH